MKAIFNNQISNAKNYSNEKETIAHWFGIVFINGEFKEVVDTRFYMSRSSDGASPVYCALWIHGGGYYSSGSGLARGCGYHKMSGAMQSALDSADIKLIDEITGKQKYIDGVGDSAMQEAIEAICKGLYPNAPSHVVRG